MNIKEPRAADGPDVLHRSHLTDLSGTELVLPLRTLPALRGATGTRELQKFIQRKGGHGALSAGTKQTG